MFFFEVVFPQISGILENVPWGKISRNFQNFPKFPEIFRKFPGNFPPKFPGFRTRGETKIQPVNLSFFCQNSRKFPPDFPEFREISEISEFRNFTPKKGAKCKDTAVNLVLTPGKIPEISGKNFPKMCQISVRILVIFAKKFRKNAQKSHTFTAEKFIDTKTTQMVSR